MYKDLAFIRDVYKDAKPGDPICNSKGNTSNNIKLNYEVLQIMGAFSNHNTATNFNDLSNNFYNELENLCGLASTLSNEELQEYQMRRQLPPKGSIRPVCDITLSYEANWDNGKKCDINESEIGVNTMSDKRCEELKAIPAPMGDDDAKWKAIVGLSNETPDIGHNPNRPKFPKCTLQDEMTGNTECKKGFGKCNGNDKIWDDLRNTKTDDLYVNVCRAWIGTWARPENIDKHKKRLDRINKHQKTDKDGILKKIPGPPIVESRNTQNHKLLWNNAKNNEYNNSNCINDNITNIMDYNKKMTNVYSNKISDFHKKNYSDNNNALFNKKNIDGFTIEPPKPMWLDMNFLSCEKNPNQELSIGQRVMAKFENYHPFKSGWMGATIVEKNPDNISEYGIRWNDGTDDKDEITGEWNWRNIDDLKIGASWYINNRNNLDSSVNDEDSERGLIPNLIKNDSDLDQTNLFTGYSDKLMGCKFETKNNEGRYTYKSDLTRLDESGKLKYGFTPEEIINKQQSILKQITKKKNISMLFLTSVSLLFFFLMVKIKNKK